MGKMPSQLREIGLGRPLVVAAGSKAGRSAGSPRLTGASFRFLHLRPCRSCFLQCSRPLPGLRLSKSRTQTPVSQGAFPHQGRPPLTALPIGLSLQLEHS